MYRPGELPSESPREGCTSEFILLVAQKWQSRMPDVLAALHRAGADVTAAHEDCGIVEGRLDAGCVEAVSGLAQVAALAWRRLSSEPRLSTMVPFRRPLAFEHGSRLMNSRIWQCLIAAALFVAPLAGCDRQGASAPSAPPAPEVAVVTVQPQSVVLTTELPGRTSGYLVAEVRPQVSGLIQKRFFTEGSDVKAGDLLYQIDPAPFQAAHDSALANLDAARKAADRARAAVGASTAGVARQQATVTLAKTNRQRLEDLFREKAVSASERDQAATDVDVAEATLKAAEAQVESDRAAVAAAEAAIQQAEAALETTRINLGYTKVAAPIPGRIGRSNVTEGAIVTAYQAVLATIQAMDPIYVDVPQSTAELMRLRRALENGRIKGSGAEADKVRILLEDGTAYPLEGTLQFRDISVDPTTASVILRVVVPNPEGILLPGMFVRAVIEEGVDAQAILVPQQAVSRDQKGNPLALVVDAENKIQQRTLATSRALGDKWLVSSGLAAGDRLVVEGMQKVRLGAPARPVPFEQVQAGAATAAKASPDVAKSN